MKTVNFDENSIAPSKVICIGRNYVDHIAELGNEVPDEMVVFLKPNSAISSQLISFHHEKLHYEAELCFLYQKNDPKDKNEQGKFTAVAIGLDLTKRDLQAKLKAKGLPWERAKGFDGAALFSDFVAIDTIDNSLQLELTIDGKVMQSGGVELMMYKPDTILAQLSSFVTLEDGDIVMTGTPKGVGEIVAGSEFIGKVKKGNETLISASWLAS
ncbi:fumarylacetoacetate hydrolase family protein [Colwellia sp. 4_MG-2023]|uniref:fumarylacetoacetate hydrolase family protein n=1 Tax=unclassified Colwellia TaxID=196834 RepID=UPI0026E241C5|nr:MULTISPECIES: fumarylacetoacetate hydrolase family protein [unclassified Colwellia]MDO6508634.1 fumarylacetoacetate hydrolase family protein [Colwellia sp. 5_MG-2023]MDO6557263.1 fumarylacetoacetate hydrolase family protein [Colwellia sp. 4_MG-2023]